MHFLLRPSTRLFSALPRASVSRHRTFLSRTSTKYGIEVSSTSSRASIRFASDTTATATTGGSVRTAAEKHKEMQNVLRGPAASAESLSVSPSSAKVSSTSQQSTSMDRKARYRQALINAGISFFTVILAAQGVKNAHDKRKAERELEAVVELLEEKRTLLKSLHEDRILRPIAQECIRQVRDSGSYGGSSEQRGWWAVTGSRSSSTSAGLKMEEALEESVTVVLRESLMRTIGTAGMTTEEKDKNDMEKIAISNAIDLLPLNDEADILSVSRKQEGGGTEVVVKKKMYAF